MTGVQTCALPILVVFLYTAPIFVALGLHWKLPTERLSPVKWVGIGLAFAGIVFTFFGRTASPTAGASSHVLLGDLLGLLAGVAWGATTVVVRTSSLARVSAAQTLLYQLVAACVLLLGAAWALGQTAIHATPLVGAVMVYQSLVVSFASFLVWFWLLRGYLASRLSVFSFMTPLFGMGFSVWLLHEPLEPGFVAGAVCVLAGVVLVSGDGWLRLGAKKQVA